MKDELFVECWFKDVVNKGEDYSTFPNPNFA